MLNKAGVRGEPQVRAAVLNETSPRERLRPSNTGALDWLDFPPCSRPTTSSAAGTPRTTCVWSATSKRPVCRYPLATHPGTHRGRFRLKETMGQATPWRGQLAPRAGSGQRFYNVTTIRTYLVTGDPGTTFPFAKYSKEHREYGTGTQVSLQSREPSMAIGVFICQRGRLHKGIGYCLLG